MSGGSSKDKLPGVPIYRSNPGLLPINSRSLGKFVIDFYQDLGFRNIYFAINAEDFDFAVGEFGNYKEFLRIIPIEDSKNVTDTLEKAMVEVNSEEVIVNLVTTIPKELLKETNTYCVDIEEKIVENWSAVNLSGAGSRFISKFDQGSQSGHAFSGVFRLSSKSLKALLPAIEGKDRSDLLSVIVKVSQTTDMKPVQLEWYDCGHIQNYYSTRRKIFGSRFFNSISLDENRGILSKRSTQKDKLKREINYQRLLPDNLKIYFPRVLTESETPKEYRVDMEFYGYPALAEILLYWDLSPSLWKTVFDRLGQVLNNFYQEKQAVESAAWRSIYVDKVTDRVTEFKTQIDSELAKLFFSEKLLLNDDPLMSWSEIEPQLQVWLSKIKNHSDEVVVHGDFCLNNILCDPFAGIVKLIDPRGSFGTDRESIAGDRKYDWAKLGHSFVGKYDYIVNDLFELDQIGNSFYLKTFDRPWQKYVETLFVENSKKFGIDNKVLSFIIGTLFVSMTPLHSNSLRRQKAFYLTGLKFFTTAMKE